MRRRTVRSHVSMTSATSATVSSRSRSAGFFILFILLIAGRGEALACGQAPQQARQRADGYAGSLRLGIPRILELVLLLHRRVVQGSWP